MRTLVLSAAIAAVAVVLSACSPGSGSQSIPAGAQGASPAHNPAPALNRATIHVVEARPDAGCPKKYGGACMTVNAASGGSILLCYGSCGSINYQWSSTFTKGKKQRPFGKLEATFTPNPGNLVTDQVTEKRPIKSSNGKYKYLQHVKICEGSSCATGLVAIATE